jgi:hypothetical protein
MNDAMEQEAVVRRIKKMIKTLDCKRKRNRSGG